MVIGVSVCVCLSLDVSKNFVCTSVCERVGRADVAVGLYRLFVYSESTPLDFFFFFFLFSREGNNAYQQYIITKLRPQ